MNNKVEILLVEDNMDDAALTIRALKKHKLTNSIVHLKDGAQALDFIFAEGEFAHRSIQDGPKAILLDLNMPKVNGKEVLARVKADERTRHIPVVILTSSNEDPDITLCRSLGAATYLVKPVGFTQFVQAILTLGLSWTVSEP